MAGRFLLPVELREECGGQRSILGTCRRTSGMCSLKDVCPETLPTLGNESAHEHSLGAWPLPALVRLSLGDRWLEPRSTQSAKLVSWSPCHG
jgi:hypothetical protein